jgi:hypothetical protein
MAVAMGMNRIITESVVNFARSSLAVAEIDEVVIDATGVPSPWDGRETWIARVKSGARTWLIKVKIGRDGAPSPSLLKIE